MSDRNYEIKLMPCVVTGKFSKCILVQLGKITDPNTGLEATVEGQFSEEGLRSLLADLTEAPPVIALPTNEEIRQSNPYGWGVKYQDGTEIAQYPADGSETPFSTVHLPNVIEFWLLPREAHSNLPAYILSAAEGFYRRVDGVWTSLELDYPIDEPFEWHYYRRNTLTFSSYAGQTDNLPAHVVQVLGWRIGDEILEIGVEEDGSWQVYRNTCHDPGNCGCVEFVETKVIETDNRVRMIDPIEVG